MPSPAELNRLVTTIYPKPPDSLVAATRDRIRGEGGYADPIDVPHRDEPIDYNEDPAELTNLRHPDEARRLLTGQRTCGCGRRGSGVGLQYDEEPDEDGCSGESVLRACVHCDAVHKMPRFRPSLR